MSDSPAAVLSAVTPQVLRVRPAVPTRTASARSLPKSTQPRISILIPTSRIPEQLLAGVTSSAEDAVRGNVQLVEAIPKPASSQLNAIWIVG